MTHTKTLELTPWTTRLTDKETQEKYQEDTSNILFNIKIYLLRGKLQSALDIPLDTDNVIAVTKELQDMFGSGNTLLSNIINEIDLEKNGNRLFDELSSFTLSAIHEPIQTLKSALEIDSAVNPTQFITKHLIEPLINIELSTIKPANKLNYQNTLNMFARIMNLVGIFKPLVDLESLPKDHKDFFEEGANFATLTEAFFEQLKLKMAHRRYSVANTNHAAATVSTHTPPEEKHKHNGLN